MPDDPASSTPVPFAGDRYRLALRKGLWASLEPVDAASARTLGTELAGIDPWRTLGIGADELSDFLLHEDPHSFRKVIRCEDAIAGVVAVRSPWLFGPYLNLLAILSPHQATGVGSAVIQWMADQAQGSATNLWVCVSEFNTRALAFYKRNGFELTADLPDLVRPGFAELLLRKQLRRAR